MQVRSWFTVKVISNQIATPPCGSSALSCLTGEWKFVKRRSLLSSFLDSQVSDSVMMSKFSLSASRRSSFFPRLRALTCTTHKPLSNGGPGFLSTSPDIKSNIFLYRLKNVLFCFHPKSRSYYMRLASFYTLVARVDLVY